MMNFMVFTITPIITNGLPFKFWFPFDPRVTSARYYSIYVYEVFCALSCSATNLSVNMYMFVVFICLNFYYAVLGERAQLIGYQTADKSKLFKQSKIDIYKKMIEIINFHLKINE